MKIVAKVLVLDNNRDILVLRRSASHPRYPLHWDFPGGKVEDGEKSSESARREIEEETNMMISSDELEPVFRKIVTDKLIHELFTIKIDQIAPEILTSWEHDDYRWFGADNLLVEPVPSSADPYFLDVMEWLSSGALENHLV